MDDVKRDNNKVKRSKSDVKNVISSYLQRRNYPSVCPVEISKSQLLTQHLVESGVSRPNSILYSGYSSDPVAIEQNFGKFLLWLKDLTKNKNKYHDIEYLVGPLFCHLYLDILRGGTKERASAFLKSYLPSVDKLKCDNMVQELINSFPTDEETVALKEFRSNKYLVDLYKESLVVLKEFVRDNCHVVFHQVLQTWFEIQEIEEVEEEEDFSEEDSIHETDTAFAKLHSAIGNLDSEPDPIFNVNISNYKHQIDSGLINRQCGLMVFSENNQVTIKPLHSFDSILNNTEYGDIKLTGHSGQVYSIDISLNNNYIVTGSSDTTICIYNLRDFQQIRVCKGHLGPVYCTKISTNSEYVISGSQDKTARLWSLETGQAIRVFVGHTQSITSIDFHPNCLYIATGSADKNVRMWCVENGNPMRLFHGAKGIIYAAVFHPKGQCLASASEDKKVRIWDLVNAKVMVEFEYLNEPFSKLIWSKDGKKLCGGTFNGNIAVWDFEKIQQNLTDTSYHEPISSKCVNNKLLCLEYAFGTFGTLTTT
ncbi:unnamed protein product [Brassicogethes aeneus]|uniref:TFIID subunit TAF5 NTD2 domain-containing protein n=1 Tax=Brassicogethes aeneus TaxID=1431903 RepID=A0A9P0BBT1_BRAAE|nr:unnamed protein product [Brassicogethes aeneus]